MAAFSSSFSATSSVRAYPANSIASVPESGVSDRVSALIEDWQVFEKTVFAPERAQCPSFRMIQERVKGIEQIKIPFDILAATLRDYIPDDMENCAVTCHEMNGVVNSERFKIWETLLKHPMARFIVEQFPEIQEAPTIKKKMSKLAEILCILVMENIRTKDNIELFGKLLNKLNHEKLFRYASRWSHSRLFDSISIELLSSAQIESLLKSLIGQRNSPEKIRQIEEILHRCKESHISSLSKSAIHLNDKEALLLILKMRNFLLDNSLTTAATENKAHFIPLLFASNNRYTTAFCSYGGLNMRENVSSGLQEALIRAVGSANPISLEELLKAKPSMEILEHLHDLAIYYKLVKEAEQKVPEDVNGNIFNTTQRLYYGSERDADIADIRTRIPVRFQGKEIIYSYIQGEGNREAIIERIEQEIKRRSDLSDEKNPSSPLPLLALPAIAIEEVVEAVAEPLIEEEIPQALLLDDVAVNRVNPFTPATAASDRHIHSAPTPIRSEARTFFLGILTLLLAAYFFQGRYQF